MPTALPSATLGSTNQLTFWSFTHRHHTHDINNTNIWVTTVR